MAGARRLVAGENRRWEVRVSPNGPGDVTVALAATESCSASGAICTPEGKMQSTSTSATVSGPALSVSDASVAEGSDARLEFTVSLNHAAAVAVTVDYATADVSAVAAADYTATSGTLTFAIGDTSKTVEVAVLDDAHDEGSETMKLVLSNASGARIADSEGAGTIENTDPMPRAWTARFGRTVGSHVVEGLAQRLEGGGGSHVTVAGIPLGGGATQVEEERDDDPFALPGRANSGTGGAEAWTLNAGDVLLGTSFHLSNREAGGAGAAFTAWGRVETGGFEAEVDDVTMDGDVTTGLVGFDAEWEHALAGVMLSQSSGDGAYRLDPERGDDAGRVESNLTGVYPYARIELDERVSAWGLAGGGSGTITLTQQGHDPMKTDLSLRMGALGLKGRVLDGSGPSGLGVNVKSDAMWVRTKSERSADMVATEGDVTRLRLVVEGERAFELTGEARFTPSAQIGLRHDGGDAETGTGVEVGAGMRYTRGALTVEGRVRTLVAHEDSGYREWGASGAIRVTPGASGRGLTFGLRPEWGRTSSAAERLWSARDAGEIGPAGEFEATRRLVTEIGYGLGLPGRRGVVTPYAALSVGEGGGRTVRGGARFELGRDLAVRLEATRSDSERERGGSGATGENEVRLRAALRF